MRFTELEEVMFAGKKLVFLTYFLLQLVHISSWSCKMIYKLVWLLLQTLVTIYRTLLRLATRLHLIGKSYDQIQKNTNKDFQSGCDVVLLEQCRRELTKIPQHISIIIGPDEHIESQLISQVINYSLLLDVNCISIYDTRETEGSRINIQNIQPPKDIFCKQLGERHFVWRKHDEIYDEIVKSVNSDSNGYVGSNGTANGHRKSQNTENSIEIYQIMPCEGHKLIASVCRDLFTRRHTDDVKKLLQNRTLLTNRIDEELSQHLWKSKDPEIAIVFGKQMCTFGMLPWQTRFTEFFLHREDKVFNAKSFAKILYQYSRCEQRWGK